jgi:hypothetical protein
MKKRGSGSLLRAAFGTTLIACAALAGCASTKPVGPAVPAAEVELYNSTQLTTSQYSVVQHIYIDPSKSAFTYPAFDKPEDGIQAMKEVAGKLGAKGIVNVMCLDGKGWEDKKVLCYGDAIKFN